MSITVCATKHLSHAERPLRAHPARDQAAHTCGWCIPGRTDGAQPGRRQAAAHCVTAWSTKRYSNIELLKDQQMRGAITA